MTKKISYRQAKKALRRIVNARGHEYTYEYVTYEDEYGESCEAGGCLYSTQSGRPSCLVGELLHEVAKPQYQRLHQFEWDNHYSPEEVGTINLVGVGSEVDGVYLETIFDERALRLLHQVQSNQDSDMSWGESLSRAIKNTGS